MRWPHRIHADVSRSRTIQNSRTWGRWEATRRSDGGCPYLEYRGKVKTITREELKTKLDREDDFKLVMALGGWYFRAVHIPGSISVSSPSEVSEKLDRVDEIIVYCTSPDCPASKLLYLALERAGYVKIRRYEDGIHGWLEAGYPLEGEQVG